MTKKQKSFADEYLIDLNATQGSQGSISGYKAKDGQRAAVNRTVSCSRNTQGCRSISQRRIAERSSETHRNNTADRVLEELAGYCFCKGRLMSSDAKGGCAIIRRCVQGLSDRAIQSVKVKAFGEVWH